MFYGWFSITSRYTSNNLFIIFILDIMKRIISLVVTSLILWWIALYCGYLMSQWTMNVTADLVGKEIITFSLLLLLCLAVWYYSTLWSHHLQKPKIILGTLGVMMIMYGSYAIVDVPWSNTFLSDLTRIAWVYVLIASIAWFIWLVDGEKKTGTGSAAHRIKNAEVIEI